MTQRIVVVGAGIAGLASAVALRRRGYDVSIVEQRTDTTPGAAISIWPNALAALDELGLGDEVRDAGARVATGALRWRDGSWLRRPATESLISALGEPLVVLRRSALRNILTAAAADISVEYGLAASKLEPSGDGIRIELSDGAVRCADAVIGADGIGSMVARHLNGPLRYRYAGYTAWRGIAACGMDPDLAGATLGPGVETGHIPCGPDLTYWYTTERAPEGRSATDADLPYLRAKLAGWPEPVPDVLAATTPDDLLRNDLYDREPARRWARGPVVVVGDAAHPMRPHLGQGGCQGLEDAAILGAFVERVADLPAAFAAFADFRRSRTSAVVRESAMLGRVINLRPAFLSAALSRTSALIPDAAFTRHLASVAGRPAFVLPTVGDANRA
ncbi:MULTISPECIES: FAD-dependent oxidoreductase [Mycobacterium]|uniref:FAD-binding monooxygenase n=1 Tax=Mycobacterium gordonae TaxID=1778 RepID=A0A1X1VVH2_MYCGO|nr:MULTISPECIES: FAD-dependent oxidoreductase [Mycobacterium]MCQ4359802.1 FAD-dependent oxidoreductase [Mycobacterium gordonae]MCV7004442.1 FAD-dependent monooxygenase [Mycobacterium gordonae]ODR22215.1 FAD-binding monooxygenase [Mycobacterium gordonae]ORV73027.1 FAD-binding monooxygenase [Mycobacterium gordonae]PJE03088.1 MAG: FAD-binding monooxygenase [Mycobacterium sp.]